MRDPDYFKGLAKNEAEHFWYRARDRLLVWTVQTYFPDARRFLEIGCRAGNVLAALRGALPGLSVTGTEIEADSVVNARSRLPDVPLVRADARQMPFAGAFDVIGMFDVLEHIEEDELVLGELFRATRPGGGLVLTVPQHPSLWSIVDTHSGHRRRYTRDELIGKLRRSGFEVVRATSFVSLLLPLAWFSRMRQNRKGLDLDAELTIPPLINTALESVMAVERQMIAGGLSFPAGLSLLVVARR